MQTLSSDMTAWIDAQQSEMIKHVCALAEINSHTLNTKGICDVAKLVTEFAAVLNPDLTETIEMPAAPNVDDLGNVIENPIAPALKFTKRPNAPIQVLLMIHMDTVYPIDHPFQSLNWIDDNTLNGPGVLDAKGGIITMLTALQAFEQSPHASELGYTIIFNTDEEIGSPSSVNMIKEHAKDVHLALVYEPAMPNGDIVSTRKGSGNFAITVQGQAAHAGRDFFKGKNALNAVASLTQELNKITNADSGTTCNIGYIHGGGPVNVVPDKAVLKFNIRLFDADAQVSIYQQLKALTEELDQTEGYGAQLHGSFYNPPKVLTPALSQLMEHIQLLSKDLGMDIQYQPSGGVCDGNKIASVGTPVIDTLGPRGNYMHNPNEFVLVDSLPQRTKITAALLSAYASGQLPIPGH
ncbi:hydrolase [Planctomycetota bacterium]|nr:hydrolase [Planctomycetota bacterium]